MTSSRDGTIARTLAWLALCVAACAGGKIVGDDAGDTPDTNNGPPDVTVIPEAALPDVKDVAIDTFDAGCTDAGLGGIGMPAGSTATATTSYGANTPDLAIDGDFNTYWNAGDFNGSLTITFPSSQTFDAILLRVNALPTTDETYTIWGQQDQNPFVQIGQSTESAQQGGGNLTPISVTPGAYDAIRIDVAGGSSWVAIMEVALATAYCP